MIFDSNFDKCSLAGRQRETEARDENVHFGAADGGGRDTCRWRGRGRALGRALAGGNCGARGIIRRSSDGSIARGFVVAHATSADAANSPSASLLSREEIGGGDGIIRAHG